MKKVNVGRELLEMPENYVSAFLVKKFGIPFSFDQDGFHVYVYEGFISWSFSVAWALDDAWQQLIGISHEPINHLAPIYRRVPLANMFQLVETIN